MGAWGSCLVRLFLGLISLLSKVIGFGVIGVACVLITTVIFTHTHVVLPAIYAPGTWVYYWWLGVTVWITSGVWLNYLGSLGCSPGTVPPGFLIGRNHENSKPNSGKMCHFCNCSKFERVHHCSFCGHCVQKMDHHCPWINNCVGYRNQRYFNGFLLYLLIGTFFCATFAAHLFVHSERFPPEVLKNTALTMHLVICLALFVAMLGFVSWNMHLALSNQTAIETHINMDASHRARSAGIYFKNPFDLGRWRNFLAVFLTRGERQQWFRFYVKAFWDSRGRGFEGVTLHNYHSSLDQRRGANTAVVVSGARGEPDFGEAVAEEGGAASVGSTLPVRSKVSFGHLGVADRVAETLRLAIHEGMLAASLVQWFLNPAAKLVELCGRTELSTPTGGCTLPGVLSRWYHQRISPFGGGGGSTASHKHNSGRGLQYSLWGSLRDLVSVVRALLAPLGLHRVSFPFVRFRDSGVGRSTTPQSTLLLPSIPLAASDRSLLEVLTFILCCVTWVLVQRAGDIALHLALCFVLVWPNTQETVDEGLVFPRWTDEEGDYGGRGGVVLAPPPSTHHQ